MKSILFLISIFVVCSISNLNAQLAGDYRSHQNGNWNQTSTWERYNGSSWTTPASSTPDNTDGIITIRNNDTITITTNVTLGEVTINSGCRVIINSGVTLTIANDIAQYDFTVDGSLLNKGTITFSGIATMNVLSGGKYIHYTTSGPGAILDATSFSPTSTWIYMGSSILQPSVAYSGRQYGNLRFESTSGSWSISPNASNPSSCNDFYVGTGVTINNNNNALFTVDGDFILDGDLNTGTGNQSFLLTGSNNEISGTALYRFFDEFTIGPTASYILNDNLNASSSADIIVEGTLQIFSDYLHLNKIIGNGGTSNFSLASGATLKISYEGGIDESITGFGVTNFDAGANYEFNVVGVYYPNLYIADLPNDTINNLVVDLPESDLKLINSKLVINGLLRLYNGNFSLDANTVTLNGGPIGGYAQISTTSKTTLKFEGGASGCFVPGSVDSLGTLIINKVSNDVEINGGFYTTNLFVCKLNLINGRIITGNNILTCPDTGTATGNSNSYVKGNLSIKSGSGTKTLFFPIGNNQYQPVTINNINYASSSPTNYFTASSLESIPSGSADAATLYSPMIDSYWNLKKSGTINSIGSISITPTNPFPALSFSSKIGFSLNNATQSYSNLGGNLISSTLTSTTTLTAAQIADMGSIDGSFIGIGQCIFSNAGNDATTCGSYTLAGGNIPIGGTGTWSVVSGSGIFSPNANTANATVSGLSNGINSFKWNITTSDGCTADDTIIITNVVPVWYQDNDGDGYGKTAVTQEACTQPFNYAAVPGDCNDNNAPVHPGATEIPADGIDQDCNFMELCYTDIDNDDFGTSVTISSVNLVCTDLNEAPASGDCNDSQAGIHPGATEIPADGIDQDCNSFELCYTDIDNDDYGTSITISSANLVCTDVNEATISGDCDDSQAGVHPGAIEIPADGIDQDCNSFELCYTDNDNDDYGTGITISSGNLLCTDPNEATIIGDCNDAQAAIHPDVAELCNTIDDNCNGLDDEFCPSSLNLKILIQGFYLGDGSMMAVIDPLNYPLLCDTVTIELHDPVTPYNLIEMVSAPIDIYGYGLFSFSHSRHQSYYIAIRHRNCIETWSKDPVLFNSAVRSIDMSQP